MSTDTSVELCFELKAQEREDPYVGFQGRLTLIAEAILLRDGVPDRKMSTYFPDSHYEVGGLQVQATSLSDDARQGLRDVREFKTAFGPSLAPLELGDVKTMFGVLARIDRELAKISRRQGQPQDFNSYLLRVANVLDIKSFLLLVDSEINLSSGHMLVTADDTASWIAKQEDAFAESHSTAMLRAWTDPPPPNAPEVEGPPF